MRLISWALVRETLGAVVRLATFLEVLRRPGQVLAMSGSAHRVHGSDDRDEQLGAGHHFPRGQSR